MADRYKNIREAITTDNVRYRVNAIYPEVPLSEDDYYVISTGGDRYDTLAQQFYNDHTLWWIIASANNSDIDYQSGRGGSGQPGAVVLVFT